ncbi:MAG: sulfotransferase [Desulfobacteraceae bacterium]|nr:sulfotransferase [Desulfobacteraceae bacterium]
MRTETDNAFDRIKSQCLQHPGSVNMLNRAGIILERLGISPANRSEESLIADACRKTGLSDWGDESFRTALRVLLESYRKDADLNFIGWLKTHQRLLLHLTNRLYIQDALKRHPEILQEPICRPLFITGLPRTGTTLLHRLLSMAPYNRAPLSWETLSPAPPPDPRTRDTDPRIAEAEKILRNLYRTAPDFASIHPMQAKEPEECVALIMNTFAAPVFNIFANLTRYSKWLNEQDPVPIYRYYRQQIQLLQWQFSDCRWILKAPVHIYFMKGLLTMFPDACIVQTHRDPLRVIPSGCSLRATIRRTYSDHVDPSLIGQEFLHYLETVTERNIQIRKSADSAQFFDIHYKDIVQDPAGAVRRICGHFGYEFDSRFEEQIREYLDGNPKNKHGVHRYSLEQFGLTPEMVNSRFASYCERFGITPE